MTTSKFFTHNINCQHSRYFLHFIYLLWYGLCSTDICLYTFARTSNTFSFLIWFSHFSKYTFSFAVDIFSVTYIKYDDDMCSERMSILSSIGQLSSFYVFYIWGEKCELVMLNHHIGGNGVVRKQNVSYMTDFIGNIYTGYLIRRCEIIY